MMKLSTYVGYNCHVFGRPLWLSGIFGTYRPVAPRVQIPSTPSTLFSIYIDQILYLSFGLGCETNENKQKEVGIGLFFKKNLSYDV